MKIGNAEFSPFRNSKIVMFQIAKKFLFQMANIFSSKILFLLILNVRYSSKKKISFLPKLCKILEMFANEEKISSKMVF
jgi:hypothetical protein